MIHLHYDPERGTPYRDAEAARVLEKALADTTRSLADPHLIYTATANVVDVVNAALQRGTLLPADLRATSGGADGTRTGVVTAAGIRWPAEPDPSPLARFDQAVEALHLRQHPELDQLLEGLRLAWRSTRSAEHQRAVAVMAEQIVRSLEVAP